mmetsp:Transcript_5262/g.10406  ORF Transcript_5262/g.10406 Transcript_5262/m.10406 type:complete len:187 (+) Transcript_5262:464-1024(+)
MLNEKVCGILTDTDITWKVIASGKTACSTPVSLIMSGNPMSMKPTDSSQLVFPAMVCHSIRHVPVMGNSSNVIGMLDINDGVGDAMRRISKSNPEGNNCLNVSLKSIIHTSEEAPFVYDKDSVTNAAKLMAKTRKTAVLVKDMSNKVVGILTTLDLMLRVVADRLMAHSTTVARVMTPHPNTISSL